MSSVTGIVKIKKSELAREHKDIGDYTDNEVNLILSDKRENVIPPFFNNR